MLRAVIITADNHHMHATLSLYHCAVKPLRCSVCTFSTVLWAPTDSVCSFSLCSHCYVSQEQSLQNQRQRVRQRQTRRGAEKKRERKIQNKKVQKIKLYRWLCNFPRGFWLGRLSQMSSDWHAFHWLLQLVYSMNSWYTYTYDTSTDLHQILQ